ncbi:MAG TPA: bifunctional diaminohydroxyphosphoribosylaminopyrimidine deaminase/5-amino-6-(5-phosphoribosylamino)uracil reductase RibD [Candidatus Acidoferrales bacterium]|nr:bifunctional diaminohydroxyphosphoribosylaminopyrimidine deaminase/5-amino-6-(5-phosphoribosylamino)uracil reductase RibD [Candidatus Acidoferrales bacterium]
MHKPTLIHSSTEITADDSAWMLEALALARQGTALAHPNPMVGAIAVRDGEIVGRGSHIYDQRDHAEIVALREAGERARGATLYLNLEPCCHIGRTGPCTKAIIAAGIARVVAAMEDPNPQVAGKGFDELRAAGVQVECGIEEDEAMQLNEDFASWIRTGKPLVTLKAALTLDGKIAARPGEETAITGPAARAEVQRMRHAADAVLTGMGTVLADDPLLTDRTGSVRRKPLLRVVVDSQLRLPLASQLVQTAKNDVMVFTTQRSAAAKQAELERAGVEVARVAASGPRVDLGEIIRELGKRQILNLMMEAGPELNGAAIATGIVDKMVLFYASKIMGKAGVPLAHVPDDWFAKGPTLSRLTLHGFGKDFAVEGYFRDVYGDHRTSREN